MGVDEWWVGVLKILWNGDWIIGFKGCQVVGVREKDCDRFSD